MFEIFAKNLYRTEKHYLVVLILVYNDLYKYLPLIEEHLDCSVTFLWFQKHNNSHHPFLSASYCNQCQQCRQSLSPPDEWATCTFADWCRLHWWTEIKRLWLLICDMIKARSVFTSRKWSVILLSSETIMSQCWALQNFDLHTRTLLSAWPIGFKPMPKTLVHRIWDRFHLIYLHAAKNRFLPLAVERHRSLDGTVRGRLCHTRYQFCHKGLFVLSEQAN